ncbi:MAG TPA: radical SAM protein [Spirochaetota bacterium]|nr:radical SAM protein [Spirochaetota bacterium]
MSVIDSIPFEILEAVKKENLSIEVTTRCTSNCTYCFVLSDCIEYHDLDYETVFSIIMEGYEIGYRHLHITGGEPLLWQPLFDLLHDAVTMGYESIFINTNGFLLDSTIVQKLARIKGLSLSISLQGFLVVHETFRGNDSFLKATRGIEMALHYEIPVHIFCVIGKSLLQHLPHFVQWVYQTFPGIRGITLIQLIRAPDTVTQLSNELLTPDDFIALVRMISFLNIYGYCISLLENPLATVVAHLLQLPFFSNPPHLIRPGRLTVKADKSITIAHSSRQLLGMYSHGALSHILTSQAYMQAVEEDDEICACCNYGEACRTATMQRPSEPFRYIDDDIPYCKRVLDSI